jgi:hypothetical protein
MAATSIVTLEDIPSDVMGLIFKELLKPSRRLPFVRPHERRANALSLLLVSKRMLYVGLRKVFKPSNCQMQGMARIGDIAFFRNWIQWMAPHRLKIDYKILVMASVAGNVDLLDLLLSTNAELPANPKRMHCCLETAAAFGHITLVNYLLGRNLCNPTRNFANAVMLASKNGFAGIVMILIDTELFKQHEDAHLFISNAFAGTNHSNVKKILLERGAEERDPKHVRKG